MKKNKYVCNYPYNINNEAYIRYDSGIYISTQSNSISFNEERTAILSINADNNLTYNGKIVQLS